MGKGKFWLECAVIAVKRRAGQVPGTSGNKETGHLYFRVRTPWVWLKKKAIVLPRGTALPPEATDVVGEIIRLKTENGEGT